jgi:hypothetical protein
MPPVTIATIIIGVLALSALLGWMMWRMAKAVERAERDPRYVRRWLMIFGTLYGLGALTGVGKVISGTAPPFSLIGLAIPLTIVWYCFRAVIHMKVPPK